MMAMLNEHLEPPSYEAEKGDKKGKDSDDSSDDEDPSKGVCIEPCHMVWFEPHAILCASHSRDLTPNDRREVCQSSDR